jgi:hypothetical protein
MNFPDFQNQRYISSYKISAGTKIVISPLKNMIEASCFFFVHTVAKGIPWRKGV